MEFKIYNKTPAHNGFPRSSGYGALKQEVLPILNSIFA